MNLLDGPFLELMRGYRDRSFRGKGWQEEWKRASWRGVVVGRGNLKVDADKFQVRLQLAGLVISARPVEHSCHGHDEPAT